MEKLEQITQWIGNVNISETVTDNASQGVFMPQHDNLSILKLVFGKYLEINPNITEENLIFAIQDSEDVKWQEVSKDQNLTVDIMDEFSTKIDWLILIKNRRMTKKTIKQFKDEINRVLNLRELVKAVSENQEKVVDISILINNLYQDTRVMKAAIGKGNLSIVKLLVKNGVSIGTGEYLELAIQSGYPELFDFVYDHPDNVRKMDYQLLHQEMRTMSNVYAFKRLLEHPEMDINKQASDGHYPLLCAVLNVKTDVVKRLLENPKILVSQLTNIYKPLPSPLGNAIMQDNIDIVKLFLDHPKIDPNFGYIAHTSGHTGLAIAVHQDNPEMVKLFLNHPKALTDGFSHLLMSATQINATKSIGVLITDHRMDINKNLIEGKEDVMTILHYACEQNKPEIVRLLLAHPFVNLTIDRIKYERYNTKDRYHPHYWHYFHYATTTQTLIAPYL